MTHNNFTPYLTNMDANAANFNAPLEALDAVIGAPAVELATTVKTLIGGINEIKAALDLLATQFLGLTQWTPVPIPDPVFAILPFTIQRIGKAYRVYPGQWSISMHAPRAGTTYFVSTTGDDGNDGLSAVTPLRKISTALAKADVGVIYVEAGIYGTINGWGTTGPVRNVSVIATGEKVYVGAFAEGLTWSDDSGAYKASPSRNHVGRVADTTLLDSHGDYVFLTNAGSVAACRSTVSTFYCDGTDTWVHLSDGRAVTDAEVRCYFDNVGAAAEVSGAASITVYVEGIDFEGGAGYCFLQTGSGIKTGYYYNNSFKYPEVGSNAFSMVNGGNAYFDTCTGAACGADAFNFHNSADIQTPFAVLINCIGRDAGTVGDTIDNAFTMHDGGIMVVIMGEGMRTYGRAVHSINDSYTWCLGVYAHHSLASPQLPNFVAGTGSSDNSKMWLQSCTSRESGGDIGTVSGATVYTNDFDGDSTNVGGGTVVAY